MILAIITYIVLLVVYIRGVFYIKILLQGEKKEEAYLPQERRSRLILLTLCDVIFLRRLFRVNKVLWLGEWLFHLSFMLVVLAHLRFILGFLPSWWHHLVCAGKYAGLIMTSSMIYILVVRASVDYRRYISPGNLVLIVLIFIIGLSGVLMRFVTRVDIVSVKAFMLGIFSFDLQPPPAHTVFALHYIFVLMLMLYLPSHIITAPLIASEARKREFFLSGNVFIKDEKIH